MKIKTGLLVVELKNGPFPADSAMPPAVDRGSGKTIPQKEICGAVMKESLEKTQTKKEQSPKLPQIPP